MSEKILGKVLEKADSDLFQFVSTKYFHNRFVKVRMNHISENTRIIGEIISIESVNPYFEKPTIIRYVEEQDEDIALQSLYLAKVKPLALIQNGQPKEVDFPPSPGSNVFKADESDIRLALDLEEKGIDIGYLKGSNLPFKISPGKLLRTHISILGQTGSGKSYLAAKIATEFLKLRPYADVPSQIAVPIIFDSSGEYSGGYDLGGQKELSLIMKTISIGEHHFPLLNEKYLSLFYDIYSIDEKQESELRVWLSSATDINPITEIKQGSQQSLLKQQDVKHLIEEFCQLRINSTKQFANNLEDYIKKHNKLQPTEKFSIPYNAISKMRKYNLKVKKTDDMDIIEQLSNGLIVNLSDQDNYDERQITMLLFLRQLYEAAKAKKLNSKIVLFIEEAHNYVPSVYKSFCKEEILRLAREGRKYGIILCLISQRPRWVDPTALSQCGNIFIFRIQNSDDKKHIFDSVSLPDALKDINIAKFKTGEMITTGDVVNHPMNCLVSQIDNNFVSLQRGRIKDKYMGEIKRHTK